MTRFAILNPIWIPTSRQINSAGRNVEIFTVELRRAGVIRATCITEALSAAKAAGHPTPIIEPYNEELQ